MKRIPQILIAYTLFVCAAVMTVSFLYDSIPELIPGQEAAYRINRGFLWITTYLPAAMVSGFLVGASIAFGRNQENSTEKYSPSMFQRFKTVIATGLCIVFVLTLSNEVFLPMLSARRAKFESDPENLREYVALAKESLGAGKVSLSFQYASMAREIAPKNADVAKLHEDVSDAMKAWNAKEVKLVPREFEDAEKITGETIKDGDTAYTVFLLMEKARAEFAKKEYFNAHYYSNLASEIAGPLDPNKSQAQELASDSWNELAKVRPFENEELRKFFLQKMKGFKFFEEKNYLASYYIFAELAARNPDDADVKFYLEAARQKVADDYFFIDETQSIEGFETARNICFTVPKSGHKKDVIFIKNMYTVHQTGGMMRYLRGLNIFTYSAGNKLERSISVEYAKMSSLAASTFAGSSREAYGIPPKAKDLPCILMVSLDRQLEGKMNKPEVRYYSDAAKSLDSDTNFAQYYLTMPYEDIAAVSSASKGAELMYLPDLFRFVPKAPEYGYSFEAFNQALIRRIVYPLFLLIVIVFTAILAWNYRISKFKLFRFAWIFGMPFFSFFVYFMLNIFTYIFSLLNCAFVASFASLALPVTFLIYAAVLIVVSAMFLARKSDGI